MSIEVKKKLPVVCYLLVLLKDKVSILLWTCTKSYPPGLQEMNGSIYSWQNKHSDGDFPYSSITRTTYGDQAQGKGGHNSDHKKRMCPNAIELNKGLKERRDGS